MDGFGFNWKVIIVCLCVVQKCSSSTQSVFPFTGTSTKDGILTAVKDSTKRVSIDNINENSPNKNSPKIDLVALDQKTIKGTTPLPNVQSEIPLYRLNGNNGQACILLQVDALLTITYTTVLGARQEADIYVPKNASVNGNCDNEKKVMMSLKWNEFVFAWLFLKTPGGERWYVDKIELTFNSNDRHFEHIDKPNKTIRLSSSSKHSMLFPTPVGKSYTCSEEVEINLSSGKNSAKVFLRDMKLQPFKFKNNDFATEFSCTSLSARANRSEKAPFAVGSIFAIITLLTIGGYAFYRHYKNEKVFYGSVG